MEYDSVRSEKVTLNHCEVFIMNLKSISPQRAQFHFYLILVTPIKSFAIKLKPLPYLDYFTNFLTHLFVSRLTKLNPFLILFD